MAFAKVGQRLLRISTYDKASGSLLCLASSDLLLVHRLADYGGSAEPHRNLLASSSSAVSSGVLLAMAIGCVANWLKNRSFHCPITGPLFLIAGVVFLLAGVRVIHVNAVLVWRFVLIGIGIAFLLEWRYAKRSAS